MRTVDNQRYLLSLAQLYSTDSCAAVRRSAMDNDDKDDCYHVILNNDFPGYANLDTIVREHLMDILSEEFCFLDYEEYLFLSDSLIHYMEYLRSIPGLTPDIHKGMENTLKKLSDMNTKLLSYAKRINPKGD